MDVMRACVRPDDTNDTNVPRRGIPREKISLLRSEGRPDSSIGPSEMKIRIPPVRVRDSEIFAVRRIISEIILVVSATRILVLK